jgi:hypothetical protein
VGEQMLYRNIEKDLGLELDPVFEPLLVKIKSCMKNLAVKIQKIKLKESEHENEILDHKRMQSDILNDFKKLQT